MEQMLNNKAKAEAPSKIFTVLSAILGAIFGVFFTIMLYYCLADSEAMLPLLCFFLPIAAIGLWCVYKGADACTLSRRGKYICMLCGLAVLFAFQLRLAKALYGNIAYDFNYVYVAARGMAWERTLGGCEEYFAKFPNNLFLVFLFAFLIRLAAFFGITNAMAVLTGCSVLAVDFSVLLICFCAKKLMGNKGAFMTFIISVPLLILHYGIVNPYSDTFGMVIPAFLLFLYLYLPKKESLACLITALMGVLSAVGYKIKPQTIIVVIAIGLTELFIKKIDKSRVLLFARRFASFILALVITMSALNACMYGLTDHIITDELREKTEIPFTHYLMMGMNPDSGGFINSEDYAATAKLPTQKEKIEYNLQVVSERLSNFGLVGYLRFILEKGRQIFHSVYMDMWVRSPFLNQDKLSVALQQTFCQGGEGFAVYMQLLQALWVIIFAMWVLPLIFCKNGYKNKAVTVMRLTIVGLSMFQLLFEGGARYRFHQFPIFILLAVWGMRNLPTELQIYWVKFKNGTSAVVNKLATTLAPNRR